MKKIVSLIFYMIILGCLLNSSAFSSGGGTNPNLDPNDVVTLAKHVERAAAKYGAHVIIVARVGRNPEELPSGIHYTHTGIGVYSLIETDDGKKIPGYAIYNLYQDPVRSDRSYLKTDFPFDFYSGAQVLKAGVIIPEPKLQQRLLDVIRTGQYKEVHNPYYSAIANPFSSKYQNCTEYTLDVINSAIYQTTDVEVIKSRTHEYFDPQPVNISTFKLVLGSIFKKEIATSDHRNGIVTTTYTTIGNYLKKYNLVLDQFEIEI